MKVILIEPFPGRYFGGRGEFEIDAPNLFALVRALDAIGPGFAEAAGEDAAIAVDGVMRADWSASLEGAQEVLIVPRIAGG